MMAKADIYQRGARDAADYLDTLGQHKWANDIRSLCRSMDTCRVTMSQLHKDNMTLRSAKP